MGTRRFAALLRGVSPSNAKMADLKRSFEEAGFADVKTVLSSGNVLFSAGETSLRALERKGEAAMQAVLGKSFPVFVRPIEALEELLAADPFAAFPLSVEAKRVVTFLRTPPTEAHPLPISQDGAQILRVDGSEIFTAYVPSPKGPVFMSLIEKTFGKETTTRTWDTVRKLVR